MIRVIIDSAVYVDGERTELDPRVPESLDGFVMLPHQFEDLDGGEVASPWSVPLGFVWVGLAQPDVEELESWCATLRIDHFNAKEILTPHMRPVLTVNDYTLQLVLRTVQYDDVAEVAELGELTMLVRPHALMTIRHGEGSPLGAPSCAARTGHVDAATRTIGRDGCRDRAGHRRLRARPRRIRTRRDPGRR